MLSGCKSEHKVSSNLNCNGSVSIPIELNNVYTNQGHKIRSDESLTTRATGRRIRNKRRANKEAPINRHQDIETAADISGCSGPENYDLKNTTLEKTNCNRGLVDGFAGKHCTNLGYGKDGEQLIKVVSSSSYAAVVSGRNNCDLMKTDCLDASTGLLDIGNFAPLDPPSAVSILAKSATSSASLVSKRDIGVQVDFLPSTTVKQVTTKSRNQSTMTSTKGRCRNKFVSVKICCNKKELTTPGTPPVEFLGDPFTFQNALAKTISQRGIEFMERRDDVSFL